MKVNKKRIAIILLMILVYSILNIFTNYKVLGVQTTTDLSTIDQYKYRGVLPFIKELQIAYPNWSFTILNTGLDWNAVINAETVSDHSRSLTQNTDPAWLCSQCGLTLYDSGWYGASRQAVEFYMDPRNWLNGKNIFTFEELTYNSNIHNIDGVKAILRGSFMDRNSISYTDTSGNVQTINKSYAQIIMEAAVESGVSPYHLASRMRQEQGAGNSPLISGTYPGYIGYYNYFNVGATGNGTTKIIINGLKYASSDSRNPKWTSPELSIKGGAKFIASGYIGKGQNTLYLEKYNVNTTNIETAANHQYMQNISAHVSEGLSVYRAYNSIGLLNTKFNFIIPVFENMPKNISPRPTTTTNLVTENVKTIPALLNLRESSSTNSTALATLPIGTELLRIESAKNVSNGYYWDKVMYFKDNKVITGYVARDYIEKIMDKATVTEAYNTSSCAILKNAPGINTEPKQILDAGISLTVIDKMTFKIDNIIWYRVKLADGTNGYVASNFLKVASSSSENPTTPETTTPTSNVYKIDGTNLVIAPGTTIDKITGAKLEGEVLGTGGKITFNDKQYTLIILGDSNGDGIINSGDLLKIQKHLLGINDISNTSNAAAADVNDDKIINSGDLLKIQKHLLDITKISI